MPGSFKGRKSTSAFKSNRENSSGLINTVSPVEYPPLVGVAVPERPGIHPAEGRLDGQEVVCIMSTIRNMTARDILRVLREDGWYEVYQRGSHLHLEHPDKPGKVTVAIHKGTIPRGTLNSILKQAGLKAKKEDA